MPSLKAKFYLYNITRVSGRDLMCPERNLIPVAQLTSQPFCRFIISVSRKLLFVTICI